MPAAMRNRHRAGRRCQLVHNYVVRPELLLGMNHTFGVACANIGAAPRGSLTTYLA